LTPFKLLRGMCRLALRAIDRPLPPPTPNELRLTHELRSAFRSLPETECDILPASAAEWAQNVIRLRQLVMTQDPRAFLRWDIVRHTMFLAHAPYSFTELRYLRSRGDWRTRWAPALREARAGHPPPLWCYPSTSGNLLHHAYHVARFEDAVGRRPDEFTRVVEFGGGYGSMCRLFFNLGFRGKYVIFDLPAFSRLQEFYLGAVGLEVGRTVFDQAAVVCTNDLEEVLTLMAEQSRDDSIFIATWSMSEARLEDRLPWERAFPACAAFLIAFQDRFGEMDNQAYFRRLTGLIGDVNWHHSSIPHLAGNSYLFGSRRIG
jgi:hypothetical protein